MNASFHTYKTPNGSWLGWIDLPGWTIFVPTDGGEPFLLETDR